MAYESIYQVSLTPLTPDDYIDEEMFYEDFVGHNATYVDDSTDQKEGIKRLKQELGEAAEWDGNSFKIIDKEKFFRGKFIRFKDDIERLEIYSLDTFSGTVPSDLDLDMYRLNKHYSDEFGTYMYDEGNSIRTIDQFVRQANLGETWYVGKVIGYHH